MSGCMSRLRSATNTLSYEPRLPTDPTRTRTADGPPRTLSTYRVRENLLRYEVVEENDTHAHSTSRHTTHAADGTLTVHVQRTHSAIPPWPTARQWPHFSLAPSRKWYRSAPHRQVRDEHLTLQLGASEWRGVVGAEPLRDGRALVGEPVQRADGVGHDLGGDRTDASNVHVLALG
eukprot:scaffold38525_cov60-Phaeocystis_antarctica.AAC.2